jgi:hypothetical protein
MSQEELRLKILDGAAGKSVVLKEDVIKILDFEGLLYATN